MRFQMARGEFLSQRLTEEQLSKPYLEKLYFQQDMSMAQIADRYRVHKEAVRQLFIRHGIPRRSSGAGKRYW